MNNCLTIFVSPAGADTNSGTCFAPLQSLAAAQARARQRALVTRCPASVVLRGGVYPLSAPLTLTNADSGTTYAAYPGEVPVLSGGTAITGWTLADGGKNIWQAACPVPVRQLFVNGIRANPAASSALLPGGASVTSTGYASTGGFLSTLASPTDCEFILTTGYAQSRCRVASVTGTTITMAAPGFADIKAHTAASIYGGYLPTAIVNAYEFLANPGDFCYSSITGLVSYIPRASDGSLAAATAVVPTVETLVSIAGVSASPATGLTFEGITFAEASWMRPSGNHGLPDVGSGKYYDATLPSTVYARSPAAFSAVYASGLVIERCTFTRSGGAGVNLMDGVQDSRVTACKFSDLSAGAIQVGTAIDGDTAATTARIEVGSNTVTNCAAEYQGSVGINVWKTDTCDVHHNEVAFMPYQGIVLDNRDSLVGPLSQVTRNLTTRQNHVHDVMLALEDGAGIYAIGNLPGTLIQGNHVHGVVGTNNPQASGGAGIYLDDYTQFVNVQGNYLHDNNHASFIFNLLTHNNQGPNSLVGNLMDFDDTADVSSPVQPAVSGSRVAGGSDPEAAAIAAGAGPEPKYR